MAALPGGQPTLLGLLGLPPDFCCRIAEQLKTRDRIRLAATCRTLRAASVDWFRSDVFHLNEYLAPTAQRIAWLGRVQAQVAIVWRDMRVISALAAAGARIVRLSMPGCQGRQVPAELAGLTQLTELSLTFNYIQSGWEHLPRQLQKLDLSYCSLRQIPAALAGLTRLTEIRLNNNSIQGGWQSLPPQLQRLGLHNCGLAQVPAELRGRRLLIDGCGS